MAAHKSGRAGSPRLRLWPALLVAGVAFLFGIAVTGLFLFKYQMGKAWNQSIASFDWVVMAEGDTIAIDEVGRFLKKMEGVSDVTFISAEDIYEKARLDSALASDLSLLEGNPFPSGWNVHWKAEDFNSKRIADALQDIRSFPGVVDVASDPKAIEDVHRFRAYWLQAKLGLAVLMAGLVLFLVVAVGRFAFRPWPVWLGAKNLAAGAGIALVSGGVGGALLFLLL